MTQRVDSHDAQWTKAWDEIKKKLEAERARAKEKHQAVWQWEKQAGQLERKLNKKLDAHRDDVAQLMAGKKVLKI